MVEENEAIVVDFDSSRQLQEVSLTTIKAEDKSVSEIIIPMAVVEETSMVVSKNYRQILIIMVIYHYEIKALTRFDSLVLVTSSTQKKIQSNLSCLHSKPLTIEKFATLCLRSSVATKKQSAF
jgi:hypothetical protein